MRDLPAIGEFDLVWCLGDALNYLDTQDELAAALAGFRRNLAPGGVVVFDVNTLATFRTLYSSLLAVPARRPHRPARGAREPPASIPAGSADVWIDRLEPQDVGLVDEDPQRAPPPAPPRGGDPGRAGRTPASTCRGDLRHAHVTGVIEAPLDELRHAKAVYIARHEARRTP